MLSVCYSLHGNNIKSTYVLGNDYNKVHVCTFYNTVFPPAPVVTVSASALGGAPIVGGTSYSLACDHDAPQSLMATVQSTLTTPGGTMLTSLPHTFNPLLVTDGGQYSCTATVGSSYLNYDFTATQGATLNVVVESK